MSANTAIRRAATETLRIPALRILSSSASEAERIAFVKQHIRAIELCGRRTIQHAWLVGRELTYIKEQRADLRGRAWVAFTKKHFDLGETQSFNLMRVSKGYPSLKSLPEGIESVRGAISDLQVRKEIERAESGSLKQTGQASERESEPHGSSEAEFYRPSGAFPASGRTRDQLRTAQRQLAEIAASDAAAFKKVRAIIQQQHARIQGSRQRTSKKR